MSTVTQFPLNTPPFRDSCFAAQKAAFVAEPDPSLAVRRDRLDRLLALTEGHEAEIAAAIDADFAGRSVHETRMAEVFVVRAGIRHARHHLRRWMAARRIPTGLHFRPGYNRLIRQPLGVIGVVSPWNYPFQLSLGPAIGALAAGNRVMIKPSELTPATAELLDRLVRQYFAPDELAVVTGDTETGKAFVALPFDHLLFTGSTAVGRQVALAAAANLTPVTLELGGKSPAILDASADLGEAAGRIAFGKLLNAGQTCIAPDYLLVPRGQAETAAGALAAAIRRLYPTIAANPDYTAIVSPRHHARLAEMVAEAKAQGARVIEVRPAAEEGAAMGRKFPPTLVLEAGDKTRLMREEIFGPILPIVEYDGLDAAIAKVNAGGRPLALYWFGRDPTHRDRVLRETVSGGVTINDCLWHLVQEDQPFGGVGPSGTGSYHGEWGFRTFSKEKPVFHQSRLAGTVLLRPPYGIVFKAVLAAIKRVT
jgi:coniferyl-aldehyde dehydrogenase